MCGYCIESSVVMEFINLERNFKSIDQNEIFLPVYFQETTKLFDLLAETQDKESLNASMPIIFCRLWMLKMEGKCHESQAIFDAIPTELKNAFLSEFQQHWKATTWEFLADARCYTEHHFWSESMQQNHLLESAENVLNQYLDWWTQGIDKDTSDPMERMEQTGVMDPIDDTKPTDWAKFYRLFPVVFFSFLFVAHRKTDSPLLERLALKGPHDVPDFTNFDLWLQRQAFYQQLQLQGMNFILEHYDVLRCELMMYGLLKFSFEHADLLALRKLHEQRPIYSFGIESDAVIEWIDELCGIH